MELKEVLEKRRSVRKFTQEAVPEELVEELLHAAMSAPSAATENILLRAVDLGLGAVWCGIHPQKRPVERVRELLGMMEEQIPLNIIFLGYPGEVPEPRDQYQERNVHWVRA